jgi:hypothetical protein
MTWESIKRIEGSREARERVVRERGNEELAKDFIVFIYCILYNRIIGNIKYLGMASNNNEWRIMDTYFKSHRYPFTGHHLDSYREFIKNQIPGIIKSYNPITMTKYNDDKEEIFKIEIFIGGKEGTELSISRPIIYENGCPKIITPFNLRDPSICRSIS